MVLKGLFCMKTKLKRVKRKRPKMKHERRPKRIRVKTDFSDDELVGKAKNRSKKAFATLYERHRAKMKGTAYGLCRDETDAEDICQIAWGRAWKQIRNFRNDSSFGTWMTVIVRRVFIDEFRRKQRSRLDLLGDYQFDQTRPDPTQNIADPGLLPAQRIEESDRAAFVREMVAKMPEPHRTVMRLHFLEGLSHEMIARRMRTPLGTSLSRLAYGKAMLKKIIVRNLNGERYDALS